jgi:hypothetical protein
MGKRAMRMAGALPPPKPIANGKTRAAAAGGFSQ